MTPIISDAETIIHEAEQLIKNYKNTMKKHEQEGNINMANSVKGSIIGIVALLSRITDKNACDYFKEIFPEDYEHKGKNDD